MLHVRDFLAAFFYEITSRKSSPQCIFCLVRVAIWWGYRSTSAPRVGVVTATLSCTALRAREAPAIPAAWVWCR